jgi:hypothetical protein
MVAPGQLWAPGSVSSPEVGEQPIDGAAIAATAVARVGSATAGSLEGSGHLSRNSGEG